MLSIVIPTRNERDNVCELCERIEHTLATCEFEIIFVDDSTDDTPVVLAALAAEHTCVAFEHRTNASGLSSAVVRGFELAHGDAIAVMDGDLQHPPELLLPMYHLVQDRADICITSRFIPGGSDGGLNAFRKLVSWTARMMGKVMLHNVRSLSDPTTGFFAFRATLLEGARVEALGWKILIELLAVCRYQHIVEVPMRFHARLHGSTKLSVKPTLEYLEQLVLLRRRAVKNEVSVERISPDDLARWDSDARRG